MKLPERKDPLIYKALPVIALMLAASIPLGVVGISIYAGWQMVNSGKDALLMLIVAPIACVIAVGVTAPVWLPIASGVVAACKAVCEYVEWFESWRGR